MDSITKPYDYRMVLAECLPCLQENATVLAWGCQLLQKIPEDDFEDMRRYGEWTHISGQWHLVLRKIRLEELIEKFGGVTGIGLGPSNGFKYIAFGTTKFSNKVLRATAVQMATDCPGLVVECDRNGTEKPRVPRRTVGRSVRSLGHGKRRAR